MRRIRTADRVHHLPSGETLVVAYADYETGKLAPCGWPDSEVDISDCKMAIRASDEEFLELVADLAVSGDRRGEIATRIAARDMKAPA